MHQDAERSRPGPIDLATEPVMRYTMGPATGTAVAVWVLAVGTLLGFDLQPYQDAIGIVATGALAVMVWVWHRTAAWRARRLVTPLIDPRDDAGHKLVPEDAPS